MAVGAAAEGGACAEAQRREEEHIRLHSKKRELGRGTSCPGGLAHPRGQGYRQEEGQKNRVTGWAEQEARPPGRVSLCPAGWARRGPEGRGGREQAHQAARKEVRKYGAQGHLCSCEGHMLQASALPHTRSLRKTAMPHSFSHAQEYSSQHYCFLLAALFPIVENRKISSIFIQGNTYTGANINESHFCQCG